MLKEQSISVKGQLTLKIIKPNGKTIKHVFKNLVVNYGLELLARMLINDTIQTYPDYIAIGDGSTAPAVTDVALESELFRRSASKEQGQAPNENRAIFQSTWTTGTGTGTFREAGLFDAALAGNMFSRVIFADVVVDPADTLIATWEVTFSNA